MATASPEFRILGPLEAWVDDEPAPLAGPKQRAVLAFLLLNANRAMLPTQMVEAIWGDSASDGVYQTLRTYLHHLRRALKPRNSKPTDQELLLTHSYGYELRIAPEQLDANRFTHLLDQGRWALNAGDAASAVQLLGEALTLWRGPALNDFLGWNYFLAEAHHLEELRINALDLRIQASLATGQHIGVLGELLSLVERHPLREGFRLLLMRVLYRSGRPAEALSVYDEGRTILADKLGVDPSPELKALHQAILRQEPEPDQAAEPAHTEAMPAATAPFLLPADVGDLTGRDRELAQMRRLLRPERDATSTMVPIVGINGKPGAGKTALAVHAAHQLAQDYPDGQLFADLRGTEADRLDSSTILVWFLRALNVPGAAVPQTQEERAWAYRASLSGRKVLVLLDNAEHEGQVRPLLPGNPDCAVVITSRLRLTGLEGLSTLTLEDLDDAAARELLARIAGAERVERERKQAEEIIELCGHLPLAIRIAGARLASRPHWPLAALAARLRDKRRRLRELTVGDLEVRASFALSYEGCDELEQRAFRLLGLLQVKDFSAWVVAALLDGELAEAEEVCERLLEVQLLELAEGGSATGQIRYGVHELLHLFARERVEAEEPRAEHEAALERVLYEWVALAETAAALLPSSSGSPADTASDPPPWGPIEPRHPNVVDEPLEWFRSEASNLPAIVQIAYDAGLWELTWRLALSCVHFYEIDTRRDDWLRTHDLARRAAQQVESWYAEARVVQSQGHLDLQQVRWKEAIDSYQDCLTTFDKLGKQLEAARTQARMGVAYRRQGRLAEAVDCFNNCLLVFREFGDRLSEARTLHRLAVVYRQQGSLDEALGCFERCLPVFRELGERREEGHALRHVSAIYRNLEDFENALALLKESIRIFDALGDRLSTAIAHRAAGVLYREQGNLEAASSYFDRCLPVFQDLDDHYGIALTYLERGEALRRQRRLDEASDCFDRCLLVLRELGDRQGEAYALAYLGRLRLDQDRPDQATRHLEQAIPAVRTGGSQLRLATTLLDLGTALALDGDRAAAAAARGEAKSILAYLEELKRSIAGKRIPSQILEPSGPRSAG